MLINGPSANIKCNSDKNYVSFDQVHNSKYLECETVWIFLKLLCSFSICMTSVLRKYLNFYYLSYCLVFYFVLLVLIIE